MRRTLVAGNWKMHGTTDSATRLVDTLLSGMKPGAVEVAICPPHIYIPLVAGKLKGKSIAWGGQNLSQHDSGAYTGEIAPAMLRDYGCTYVIVGHSERRSLYGETDAIVAAKFQAAQKAGLVPILCVGETLEERETGVTEQVIARQLDAVVELTGIAAFAQAVLAYEPVWAIGTGKTATPEQAQQVHAFIRNRLAVRDKAVAEGLRVLYGGSVKADNAALLFAMPDIDGGLIGGASLDADSFIRICQASA